MSEDFLSVLHRATVDAAEAHARAALAPLVEIVVDGDTRSRAEAVVTTVLYAQLLGPLYANAAWALAKRHGRWFSAAPSRPRARGLITTR